MNLWLQVSMQIYNFGLPVIEVFFTCSRFFQKSFICLGITLDHFWNSAACLSTSNKITLSSFVELVMRHKQSVQHFKLKCRWLWMMVAHDNMSVRRSSMYIRKKQRTKGKFVLWWCLVFLVPSVYLLSRKQAVFSSPLVTARPKFSFKKKWHWHGNDRVMEPPPLLVHHCFVKHLNSIVSTTLAMISMISSRGCIERFTVCKIMIY